MTKKFTEIQKETGMYLPVVEGTVQRYPVHLGTQNNSNKNIEHQLSYRNQTKRRER